jgi:hypothetical protein
VNFSKWLNPSCTYFRTSDVTPVVSDDGQTITMIAGRGQHRSWGSPSVNSDARRITDTVIAIDVTGWHKHTVGPVGGTYYFVNENGRWVRRTANHKAVKAALAQAAH